MEYLKQNQESQVQLGQEQFRAVSTTTPSLSGDLTDGNSNPFKLFTFINELRDHDSVISGEYEMTDLGGGNRTKNIF